MFSSLSVAAVKHSDQKQLMGRKGVFLFTDHSLGLRSHVGTSNDLKQNMKEHGLLALPQARAYLAFLHTQGSPVQGMVPPR